MKLKKIITRRGSNVTEEPARLRLGDKVERLVKPIAKALNLPCLDERGDLKEDCGCAKRRDALNEIEF